MPRRVLLLCLTFLLAAAAPAAAAGTHAHDPIDAMTDTRLHQAPPVAPAHVTSARRAFVRGLGPRGVLQLDRVDGGVRWLARTDGYLSGPADGRPRDVALRWVRRHLDVLGLEDRDLATLHLVHQYTAINGVTRLIFQQRAHGIPAFDDTLRVNVARDGRIVNVGGSPRSGLAVPSTTPELTAEQAILAAASDKLPLRVLSRSAGARRFTRFAGGHLARLVIAATGPRATRLAWRVWVEESDDEVWSALVDARTGKVLRRASQVKWSRPPADPAKGLAWDYYPGAPRGGTQREVDLTPWLSGNDRLKGNNTHVYNDADASEDCAVVTCSNDDLDPTQAPMGDLVFPHEEIRPQGITGGDWMYPFNPVPSPAGHCPESGCAWNHLVNFSWVPNRNQDGTQVFFFVNRFHDHLLAPPIAFTEAAGNFQFENPSGQGKGNDGIFASSMDAAGMAAGRPVPIFWSDNANMLTRPDGRAPRMQMFLFEPLDVLGYPFSDVSGGGDGSIVYHEYTHGLSNRLIVDAEGEGAVHSAQSGAMGEAWSDFYAMDFMMGQGFETDTDAPGEIRIGRYVDGGQDLVRTSPMDCRPGDPQTACPRKRAVNPEGGGYTYDDFGKVVPGGPQVHADGEIWGQTLMDLRRRLVRDHGEAEGAARVRMYVTRAMELSPDEPSYIDMRNAILQADVVAGKRDQRRIWEVFAARGMGASASAVDGHDAAPTAAFDVPAGLPPSDFLGPAVTIDDPIEGGSVRAEAAVISGTAADDAGIVSLTVNGAAAQLDGSTWTTTLKLAPGRREIVVQARDIESRTAMARRIVDVDARRPRLRLGRLQFRRGRILVRGRVRDDVGGHRVRVGRRTVPVGRGGLFFAAVKPPRGPLLRVIAYDRAGRSAKKSVRVR